MLTKPCPRAGRIGCLGTITERDKNTLARRRTCSLSCAMHARRERGFQPVRSRDAYVEMGRKGGRVTGGKSHKAALRRAIQQMQPYIPKRLLTELTREQVALGLTLIARAVRVGYKQGLSAKAARESYARRKQGKAA